MVNIVPEWYSRKPWSRHGLILVTVGFLYIGIGSLLIAQPPSETRERALNHAFDIMPYQGWCIGFMVVGAISVMSSAWPYSPKSLGYSTLSGWTVLWAGFNIIGGFEIVSTVYIASGFVWVVIAFLWWAISGLVSPPRGRIARGVGAPSRYDHGCIDCGSVCVCNPETVGKSEPQDSGTS